MRGVFVFVALLASAFPVFAQQGTADLRGKVVDQQGGVLPGVTIVVRHQFDADRNGETGNEYLPAGTYSGTGEDAITVDNKGGRRGARGPNYMTADQRAGYRFRLGDTRTLDASFDISNVGNRANFNAPTGDRRVANFLRVTSIAGGGPTRTLQFNLRYGF